MNDKDYVLKTLNGDKAAYGMLVDNYQGMVFATALNITGNYADSQDIVQETFIKAYERLRTLSDPSKFGAWLRTIASRVALSFLRKRRRLDAALQERLMLEQSCTDSASPSELYAQRELSDRLWERVRGLPSKTREAMLLFYMENYSIKQAATYLGVSKAAVKMRLDYGREKLRDSFEDDIEQEFTGQKLVCRMRGAVIGALPVGGIRQLNAFQLIAKNAMSVVFAVSLKKFTTVMFVGLLAFIIYMMMNGASPGSNTTVSPFSYDQERNNERLNSPPVSSQHEDSGHQKSELEASLALNKEGDETVEPAVLDTADSNMNEEAKGNTSISGRITDIVGYELSGVTVTLSTVDENLEGEEYVSVTDDKGLYQIEDICIVGDALLFAGADGYVMQNREIPPFLIGTQISNMDFRLMPNPFFVAGYVEDADGCPLSHALVYLRIFGYGIEGEMSSANGTFTYSGEDGRFEIGIQREGYCAFYVCKAGYGPANYQDIYTNTSEVHFILQEEGGITGTVRFPDGTPAKNYSVHAIGEGGLDSGSHLVETLVRSVLTDDEGKYSITGLGAGISYEVVVCEGELLNENAEGGTLPAPRLAVRSGVMVESGTTTHDIDFVLRSRTVIKGAVVSSVNRKALASIAVDAYLVSTNGGQSALLASSMTDVEGFFELSLPVDEKSAIKIVASYAVSTGRNEPALGSDAQANLHVQPGESVELTLVVEPSGTIPIRVVDQDDNPVQGARSWMYCDGRGGWTREDSWTDAEGRYVWRNVPPGDGVLVNIMDEAGPAMWTVSVSTGRLLVTPGETLPEITLVLFPKGGFEGIICDDNGEIVSNSGVAFRAVFEDGRDPLEAVHPSVYTTVTDANGYFTFLNALPEGTYPRIAVGYVDEGMVVGGWVDDVTIVADTVVNIGTLHSVRQTPDESDATVGIR